MKLLFLTTVIGMLSYSISQAQNLRLNGYASYVFSDRFEEVNSLTSFYEGRINGAFQWGVGLESNLFESVGVELLYLSQDTEIPIRYYDDGVESRTLDVTIRNILIGGNKYLMLHERIEGYAGLLGGVVIYDIRQPRPDEPDANLKLSVGGRLGANLWMTETLGLKVQAQLLSTIQGVGGGFYLGTGGSGAGVNTYSTVLRFSLGGGLVVR